MVLLRYVATVVPALAALAALELVFAFPARIGIFVLAFYVVLVAVHAFLGGRESRSPSYWQFAIPPATLFIAGAAYSLLVESPAVRHGLALIVFALLVGVYWNLYIFLYQPVRYQPHSLEHLSILCNLLTVFFGATSLYGLSLYLGLGMPVVAAFTFFGGVILVQQSFWVSKLKFAETAPFLVIIPLFLTELSLGFSGLPVTHTVTGAAFTLAYYALLGVVRRSLRGTWSRRAGWRYAIVTFAGILAVFLTARWS